MCHFLKDNIRLAPSLFLLGVVVGIVVSMLFTREGISSKYENMQRIEFLLGEHCYDEAKEYLADLDKVDFTTTLDRLTFSLGEYPSASYVASISFENLSVEELKAYARGATENCSASATAAFGFDDVADLQELSTLLNFLERNGSDPILLDLRESKIFVRFRRNF